LNFDNELVAILFYLLVKTIRGLVAILHLLLETIRALATLVVFGALGACLCTLALHVIAWALDVVFGIKQPGGYFLRVFGLAAVLRSSVPRWRHSREEIHINPMKGK
jgi:hypothetical protein